MSIKSRGVTACTRVGEARIAEARVCYTVPRTAHTILARADLLQRILQDRFCVSSFPQLRNLRGSFTSEP